jgi:hypothetical protein
MNDFALKNYQSNNSNLKAKLLRVLGISAVFVGLGLAIVAADQIGQHWRVERNGYVQEMANNPTHLCKTMGCLEDAHDAGYETPEQKAYYFEHITLPRRAHAKAQHELAARLKKEGITMDYDAEHAYDE